MFCQYNGKIVNTESIKYIVCNHYPQHNYILVHYSNYESECVKGADAVQVMTLLCPQVLEQFEKDKVYDPNAWALHNLVGRPLMQICMWLRFPKLSDWFRNKTIPKPKIIDN